MECAPLNRRIELVMYVWDARVVDSTREIVYTDFEAVRIIYPNCVALPLLQVLSVFTRPLLHIFFSNVRAEGVQLKVLGFVGVAELADSA